MQTTKQITIIDADGLILGRMATSVAKRILNGEEIVIINAEKAILSGKKRSKLKDAIEFLSVGQHQRGPFHYRRPDKIVRKSVRGMLPFKQPKGKQAYKRLKVYMGVPTNLKDQKMETLPNAQAKKLTCPYFTVGEFSKEIGWNAGE
ncbi:50S ribosomal protein L13 [Candidatus Bathyarchaeota archaeon]|nr:50S ribosomal protein L13 [Candidatus Bathyarchaeota archaeon]